MLTCRVAVLVLVWNFIIYEQNEYKTVCFSWKSFLCNFYCASSSPVWRCEVRCESLLKTLYPLCFKALNVSNRKQPWVPYKQHSSTWSSEHRRRKLNFYFISKLRISVVLLGSDIRVTESFHCRRTRPQHAVESDLWSSNAYVMSGFSLGSHYYNVSNNLKNTLAVDYTCFHFADPFKFMALWWKRKYLTHVFLFQYKTEIFCLIVIFCVTY